MSGWAWFSLWCKLKRACHTQGWAKMLSCKQLSTTGTVFVLNILWCWSPMPSRLRTLCRGCRTGLPACISWRAGTTTLCQSLLGWRAGTTILYRSQLYPPGQGLWILLLFSSLLPDYDLKKMTNSNNVQIVQLGPISTLKFLEFYTFFQNETRSFLSFKRLFSSQPRRYILMG